jgi:hypothetical protein
MTTRRSLAGIVPRVSLAVLAAMLLAAGWRSASLESERRVLRDEISRLRADMAHPSPGAESMTASADLASLREELDRELAAQRMAADQVAALEREMPALKSSASEVRSLGRVEALGAEALQLLHRLHEIGAAHIQGTLTRTKVQSAVEELLKWAARADVIGEMESQPEEIAELHAIILQKELQLDEPTTQQVGRAIEQEFIRLQAARLTRPYRPPQSPESWQQERGKFLRESAQRVEALIPITQRRPWIVDQTLQLGNALEIVTTPGSEPGVANVTLGCRLPNLGFRYSTTVSSVPEAPQPSAPEKATSSTSR